MNNRAAASRYRVTIEKLIELKAIRVCGACGTTEPGTAMKKKWHIDHDHATGVVRGVLCWRCNTLLGRLGDSRLGVLVCSFQFEQYLTQPQLPPMAGLLAGAVM